MNMLEGMDVSVGVCFIDINGLKNINDNQGHDEGDAYIKETADVIASAFKKKYCYRVGGDEFIVIIPQITKDHFEEVVEKFRKKAKAISIAAGAIWSDNAKGMENLVNQADKLMYVDKEAYFGDHERRHKI